MTTGRGDAALIESYLENTYGRGGLGPVARDGAKRLLTALCLPTERRKARRKLRSAPSLRLHLGAAATYLDGWCNVDYARPGRRLDLRWDLRRPLPLPDGCAEAVFSEHLFEHIPYPGVLALLRECHRLLRPGGVCRIGVPDFERYARAYVGENRLIDQYRPGAPTKALAVAEIFFLHGHRSSYDFATLATMATASGFTAVERSEAGRGRISPCPDSPSRAVETLYVDAVK